MGRRTRRHLQTPASWVVYPLHAKRGGHGELAPGHAALTVASSSDTAHGVMPRAAAERFGLLLLARGETVYLAHSTAASFDSADRRRRGASS
jgi:hypothetical protein